jgi:chromosomal replication initiation ATPase DnaA
MARQLVLDLPVTSAYGPEDFLVSASNTRAFGLIENWPDWPDRLLRIEGPTGSGKSHLAAIWAEASGARSTTANGLTAEAVPAALATGALVVEDPKPREFDERALFHLMNLAREDGAYVLFTGREAPASLEIELADLRSRLRAVPVISLLPPDDQLFRGLIVKFCADRQLAVDESVVSYLATRLERSSAAARRAVDLLDSEALRLGRPVTRALAAELLRDV